jgi:hypothetical protein
MRTTTCRAVPLSTAMLALIGALGEAIGRGSRLPPVRHSA